MTARRDPRRPRHHLTPAAGWINDPYGVTYADGRYRLFCQYDPDGVHWVPGLSWGVAESADLVHWSPLRTALEPADPAYGCWSGTAVEDGGETVLLYTRVDATPGRHDIGQVVLARPRGDRWVSEPTPVLAGPPPGLGARHFRDPYLLRTGDGWLMLLGAGLAAGTGAVLGYRSADLRHWEYTGVVCSRPATAGPLSTGSVWECPQLFELAGQWVLVVSVANAGPEYVVAATGTFDGRVFRAGEYHRLDHGHAAYATTTFLDADGRRCALSWLREPTPTEGFWSGALSLPAVLSVRGDRVTAAPHPVLDTLRGPATDRVGPYSDVSIRAELGAAGAFGLDLGTLGLVADRAAGQLRLTRPGRADDVMPLGAGADGVVDLRLVLDGGVAEVYSPSGMAALRIEPVDGVRPRPTGAPVTLTCHILV